MGWDQIKVFRIVVIVMAGLLVSCGRGNFENEPAAESFRRYYQRFIFQQKERTSTYLQGAELRLLNARGNVHGKINLFLLEGGVFVFEWREITDIDPNDGWIYGPLDGVVITGKWVVSGSELRLEMQNQGLLGTATVYVDQEGEEGINLKVTFPLRSIRPALQVESLSAPRPLLFRGSRRPIPSDPRQLSDSLDKDRGTMSPFKDRIT